jgi:hypothetical protein
MSKKAKKKIYSFISIFQFSEHMKLLKATERAYDLESQKRDILQEFIDDYETNIYRVDRFYKISSINLFFLL